MDLDGQKLWERTYTGGSASSLQSTDDGGYIIVGRIDDTKTGRDALLIKTDSTGSEEWSMTLGGSCDDIGTFVVQSGDGSYTLAGITSSYGLGREDAWLVKIRCEQLSDGNEDQLQNLTFPNSTLPIWPKF